MKWPLIVGSYAVAHNVHLLCRWIKDDVFGYVLECNRNDNDLIILDPVDYGEFQNINRMIFRSTHHSTHMKKYQMNIKHNSEMICVPVSDPLCLHNFFMDL